MLILRDLYYIIKVMADRNLYNSAYDAWTLYTATDEFKAYLKAPTRKERDKILQSCYETEAWKNYCRIMDTLYHQELS